MARSIASSKTASIGLFVNEISTHSLDEITIHGISWYIGEANANIVWILGAWKEVQ
jgi:hypothetical protein